jgi:hypothetical protein
VSRKSNTVLENDLNAYSGSATVGGAANWRRHLRNWPSYAAAAGSALALATAADANTIVYSGPKNIGINQVTAHGTAVAQIDLDGQDFELRARVHGGTNCACYTASVTLRPLGGGQMIGGGSTVVRTPFGGQFKRNKLKGLQFGAAIPGQANVFGASNTLLGVVTGSDGNSSHSEGSFGKVFGKRGAFAGVKFTAADGVHYGWIAIRFDVSVTSNATLATAISWAYNDVAGAPIDAGQIYNNTEGPTPPVARTSLEPSSQAFALLSTGADGVLAWKRRRLQLVSQEAASQVIAK